MIRLLSKIKNKHLEELIRGVTGFLSFRILGTFLGYIFIFLISKWYGPAIIGVFSISLVVFRITLIFSRAGIDNAMLRFVSQYAANDHWDKVKQAYIIAIRVAIPLSLVFSVLLFFVSPFLAQSIFQKPSLSIAFRIISIIILPATLLYLNALSLRGVKRIAEYSFLVNVVPFLFGILIMLVLGKSFFSRISAPIIAYASGTVFAVLISFGFGMVQWRSKKEKPSMSMKTGTLMRVAFPMMLTASYSYILYWTDTIILGIYLSENEVGIYTVALRLATLLSIPLYAINSISASKFSECHARRDIAGFKEVINYSTSFIFWTTIPIGLVLVVFPSQIMGLFGNEISKGYIALILLISGYFINAVSGPVGTILNMTGNQVEYQRAMLCAAVVNIILNILLIPQYGINGAAFASMFSMFIWNVSSVVLIKRRFNIITFYIPFLNRIRGL